MEPLAGVEAAQQVEESLDAKNSSSPSLPKHIANPVVYKLVRVEGDGRLVPATDDEVMEVEDLVDGDKCELSSVADTRQVEGSISNEDLSHVKSNLNVSAEMPQSGNTKVDAEKLNARLEYIGVMLEKVKKEERLRLSGGSLDNSSDYGVVDGQHSDQHNRFPAGEGKRQGEGKHQGENSLRETAPRLSPRSNESSANRSETSGMHLKLSDAPVIVGSSSSVTCSSSKPDFSKIKGEICLDNLSIKELHETFRATFGRETSVKDKLWLKRRIAMGLTNSCDVPTTTFIIKDNTIIEKKDSEEADWRTEQSEHAYQIDETINNSCEDSPIMSPADQLEDRQVLSGKRMRKIEEEYEFKNESLHTEVTEQTAAKRVRKPTRRYIEELSEAEIRECSGRLASTVKNAGHGQSSRSHVRSLHNIGLDGTAFVTRQDSLGGSGVQVPYVSRVRRGRPRKSFMSLMNYHPSGSMAAKLVKKALGVCISRQDSENADRDWKARLLSKQLEHLVNSETEEISDACEDKHLQSVELENLGSSANNSDDNVTTALATKGGARRKHHRAWTLCEVMKLVEGVSKYGAGRWSEIKKVAFAPYSYRTSVDLKDKWRNLLRASFALALADKGERNSRKQAAVPIPTPILLRVRELAEKHSHAAPDLSSAKFVTCSGSNANDARSGYL